MLPQASVAPDGSLYVTTAPQDATDAVVGGVRVTALGAVHVNANAPQTFDQGKAFMLNGDLCISSQPAVGHVGGLYITDTTPPPPTGFSNGFSAGFGA